MLKAVILIGGPSKGTRFRPLSLDIPKPLFPVAGFPMIYHHIAAASQVNGVKEILLLGSYPTDQLSAFIENVQKEFRIVIKYLPEYTTLGTGGGLYHFRDQILAGSPELLFVLNADVCCDFPLQGMLDSHRRLVKTSDIVGTMLTTEATRQQSLNYGCAVEDKSTGKVTHYVEKPETFVSTSINCGVYLFGPEIFSHLKEAFKSSHQSSENSNGHGSGDYSNYSGELGIIRLEDDIFKKRLAPSGLLYAFHTSGFWSQIKSAGSAIYANRHYLNIYHRSHSSRLAVNGDDKPIVYGDVYIHPSASVHPTAVLGPNVTIGKNSKIGAGVRIRESIILEGAELQDHCCVLYSIIGWHSTVGMWSRIEGTPNDPNPNKPFAKLDILDLFNKDGKLNPAITVIGSKVQVPSEVVILNSVVLPHKELARSCKNQIIL